MELVGNYGGLLCIVAVQTMEHMEHMEIYGNNRTMELVVNHDGELL